MTTFSIMPNAFDPNTIDKLDSGMQSMIKRRQEVLGPSIKLFYRKPVEFARAEGVTLYDSHGNTYLDAYNNVPSVGHCHPRVVEAVTKQMSTLNTNTRYLTDTVLQYSERLLATHPAELDKVMYACSGSEANDLALRIARYTTGNEAVIVTANAYHGLTASIAELSPSLGRNVPIGPNTFTIPAPACQPGGDVAAAGHAFAASVRQAIADIERRGKRLAALLVDTLFSSDGLAPDPAGFLAPMVDIVHEAGGLVIADEVQAGFARSGEEMWGYQRHGFIPDLVTLGKAMGNGLPISAVIAQSKHLEQFGRDIRYFNTGAGNSACLAAANAVLEIIEDEGLQGNSLKVGEIMRTGMTDLATKYPLMTQVRGAGLFLAGDIVDPDTGRPDADLADAVVAGLRERRILVSATGPFENVLKVRPPLVFTEENAGQFLSELDQVLATIG